MNRVVIDADPGVDDAHAIMMAFARPEAQVEAITTVAGNVSLERMTANACTILDVLERDVPVHARCGRPLVGEALGGIRWHISGGAEEDQDVEDLSGRNGPRQNSRS